jgi:hypothetical protein
MRARLVGFALLLCGLAQGASSQAVRQDTQPANQGTQRADSNECRCKAPPRGAATNNSNRAINSAITTNATAKQQNSFQRSGNPRTLSRNITPIIVTDDGETAFWTKLIYRATAVLGGITALLAVFTFFLWRSATVTAKRQLRAYLGFSNRWFDGIKDRVIEKGNLPDRRPTMGMFVNNHGQTPATDVRFRGGCEVFGESEAEARIAMILDPPSTANDKPPRVCDPRPGEALPLYYRMNASVAEQADPAKKEHVYVFARVRYRDTFDDSHTSTLCIFYAPEQLNENGDPWIHAPHHNTAD